MHTKFSTIRLLDTFRKTLLRPGTDYSTREAASGTLMYLMSGGIESNTFYFNAIKDWNSLPNNLKNCENTLTYKKRVKRYLLQKATEEAGREYVYL